MQASREDIFPPLAGAKAPDPYAACGRKVARPRAAERRRMSQKYEICLRLDETEKERLETDAKRCGLTRNAYLRRLITGGEIKERPKEEIKLLRTEIHQIGNNINQFTRMANACGANAQDVQRIQQSMNQVYALMYRIGSR